MTLFRCRQQRCPCVRLVLLQLARPAALRSVGLHQGESEAEVLLLDGAAAAAREAPAGLEVLPQERSVAAAAGLGKESGGVQDSQGSSSGVERTAAAGHLGARPSTGPSLGSSVLPQNVQLIFVSVGLLSMLVCSCACLALFARSPSGYHSLQSPRERQKTTSDQLSLDRPSTWRWSDARPPMSTAGSPGSNRDVAGHAGKEPAAEQTGSSGSEAGDQPPAAMLCPQLLVPKGTRMDCVVRSRFCRRKQLETFNICGLSGVQLFQVRAEELGSDQPGIYMETLDRAQRLAFLSTEELWAGGSNPQLGIFHAWGNKYGAMRKTEDGTFEVSALNQDAQTTVLKFTGDFAGNSYKAISTSGRTVALVSPSSEGVKKVVVYSRSDAGLIILGILAIDKCEIPADRAPSDQ